MENKNPNIPSLEEIKAKEELQKCIDSPYYFFTNYVTVNGEKATTILSDREFNEYFSKMPNIRLLKSRATYGENK